MSMTDSRARYDRESGVTALLVAMSMLVLIGFAAITVDIGLAMNERRQDQAAADVASLAALQFAQPNLGCSGSACFTQAVANGTAAALDVANASLDDPSLADFTDATLCGTPPPGFTIAGTSPCVAFTSNFGRAWVRIPTIASPTFFGKLLGADQVDVSAYAIADQTFANPGPVLPFLLPGNAGSSDYNCLKTGPNPNWGVCQDLPTLGNFGSMDFFLYGNPLRNTTNQCSGDSNGRFISNLARGVDHPLGLHPTGTGPGKQENANCPNLGAEPDMADGQPGVATGLENGLLYGGSSYSLDGSSYDGLLEDGSGLLVRNSGGPKAAARVDDTPLWDYLAGGIPGVDCAGVNTPAEMLSCIAWAKANSVAIFDDSIITSQRFGFTPEVAEADFTSGSSAPYHIVGYRPVYVDTTFYGCSAGPNQCDIIHTPGVANADPCPVDPQWVTCGVPGAWNDNLNAVTAYVLSASILPEVARSPSPGEDGQRRFSLSE